MPYKDPIKKQEYSKKYHKEYYHKPENRERLKLKAANFRKAKWEWFQDYKKTLKCNRCPEDNSVCLDFHHKNPKEKELQISKAVNHCWSIKRILKEIAKCEVLCANCHRKEHYG